MMINGTAAEIRNHNKCLLNVLDRFEFGLLDYMYTAS